VTHQPVFPDIAAISPKDAVEVRLARDVSELRAAQALRYRVFYEEMGATPSPTTRATELDADAYDAVCQHLLAIADGQVIGTYRLIDRAAAACVGSFYSAGEFDIAPLVSYPGRILELGRSCVDAAWRNGAVLQLLWHGLAAYIVEHRIELLFGCASLPGTDAAALAPQLSYLRENHLAPAELRARAHADRTAGPTAAVVDEPRRALQSLPPLLKGYLRAGAMIGDGAVVDRQFNTTDVLVVLKTDAIAARYQRRYDRALGRAA
jgi:L-ornithine Nalpha-acyltransferase